MSRFDYPDAPDYPSGDGREEAPRYRCLQCGLKLSASGAGTHAQQAGHVIVSSKGVVQQFAFEKVSAPEEVWVRR